MPEPSDGGEQPPRGGLIAACRRGDPEAWEALVRGHASLVYTVIRRSGVAGPRADDVFHAVWRTASERLGLLTDDTRLDVWLVSLAVEQVRRARNEDRPGG